ADLLVALLVLAVLVVVVPLIAGRVDGAELHVGDVPGRSGTDVERRGADLELGVPVLAEQRARAQRQVAGRRLRRLGATVAGVVLLLALVVRAVVAEGWPCVERPTSEGE